MCPRAYRASVAPAPLPSVPFGNTLDTIVRFGRDTLAPGSILRYVVPSQSVAKRALGARVITRALRLRALAYRGLTRPRARSLASRVLPSREKAGRMGDERAIVKTHAPLWGNLVSVWSYRDILGITAQKRSWVRRTGNVWQREPRASTGQGARVLCPDRRDRGRRLVRFATPRGDPGGARAPRYASKDLHPQRSSCSPRGHKGGHG